MRLLDLPIVPGLLSGENDMKIQLPICALTVLMAWAANGLPLWASDQPGRLEPLAERQQIRDDVAIAMADGRIDNVERFVILNRAHSVLKPQEYAGLKQAMNRLSPPPATSVKPVATSVKPVAKIASSRPSSESIPKNPAPEGEITRLSFPTGLILPDRMASDFNAR
jgi:hypothetical protein